jgi:hypothetical protein
VDAHGRRRLPRAGPRRHRRLRLQQGGRRQADGIWVTDVDGRLTPTVKEVLALVAEHQAILGTCHLSPAEIVALVKEARDVGVEKIVVTHPFFRVPNLDLDTLAELVRLGAMPEFGYCTISPAWRYAAPEKIVAAVQRVGASRCLLVSDTGQRHNPMPSEALRVFAQTVFEKGLNEDDVLTMIGRNPRDLLDLGAAARQQLPNPPPNIGEGLHAQPLAPPGDTPLATG